MPRREPHISEEISVSEPIYQIRLDGKNNLPKQLERIHAPCRLYPAPHRSYYLTDISLEYLKKRHLKFKQVKKIIPAKEGLKIIRPLDKMLYRLPPKSTLAEVLALALSKKQGKKVPTPIYWGRTSILSPGTFILDHPGGKRNYTWRWEQSGRKRQKRQLKAFFPKLIQRITDPKTRFVISLGGGGLRLFAQPSLFRIIEALGVKDKIGEIWGCSGGAIAGLAYSLGADHEVFEEEGYKFYHNKFSIEHAPGRHTSLVNYIMTRLIKEPSVGLKGFVDLQMTLESVLERVAKHTKPMIPFYAIAFNVNLKKNEVLTSEKVPPGIYKDLIQHSTPLDAVLASTALPIAFVPREIRRGRTTIRYIDGSMTEELPLISVYDKWQLDKKHGLTDTKRLFILSVNLFPEMTSLMFPNIPFLVRIPFLAHMIKMGAFADLIRQGRIEQHIRQITLDDSAQVAILNLGEHQKTGFLSPSVIPLVMDEAKATFIQQLREIEKKL